MMYVFNETFESACKIPVPYRKWLIERYNKQKKEENKKSSKDVQPDVNQPLSPQQRAKLKNKKA